MKRLIKTTAIAAMATVVLGVGQVQAQDNMTPDDARIAYRKKAFQAMGQNMGAIGMILKGQAGNPANITHHAQSMLHAAKVLPDALKEEAEPFTEKTTALPKIWQEWDKFSGGLDKLDEELTKLVAAAESGDMQAIGAQVQATGKVCKGCHEDFREKKDKK